ncbi:methionine ABC transporter ATP-binding protein [Mangrovactinospora gilvigrisea]|uniref:Methionine ABC transporter ATP-binding protein n=1 Tax=Mangrovactinospora gilvigrisea TaxID=1428644 RepID=A0A1J7CDB3_9ACTN|nr:ATP-binding cassette domain-containing protein [Mangrovactinospora gilvigrisea]OIV37650.1 methionine ABC transporter ATP-binding protein [Mangrovactinospora gilvigrisea]
MPTPKPIIQVEGLAKEFRRPKRIEGPFGGIRTLFTRQYVSKLAVDGIDFTVDEGELIGYLGPNGAGKSTTIKILTGILQPTQGSVEVAGVVPWKERERNARNIGVVFGQRTQLWWDLPLRDSLELIGKLYGVERDRHRANIERFTELLGLAAFIDTPVRQLSLGQRMRGDLAAAMLPEPRILYLDEPTIGLDVVAKERIRAFIATLNKDEGTTVILTTHDLDDVEKLCRRIVLIDGGKVLYDGSVEKLKARYAPRRRLVVQLAEGARWRGVAMPGVEEAPPEEDAEPGTVALLFDPETAASAEVIAAVLADHQVTDLSIVEPELEGVVHRIYAAREAVA